MSVTRVLIPVDFSEDSLHAADYGADLAKRFNAEVILLYVVEPIYYAAPVDMYATSPSLATLLVEQRESARKQLAELMTKLEKQRLRVTALLKTGAPAHVIPDTAKRTKADLIVMATHGRTGLAHVLMGSVAERVVRMAECPVLTVRRRGLKKKRAPKKAAKRKSIAKKGTAKAKAGRK